MTDNAMDRIESSGTSYVDLYNSADVTRTDGDLEKASKIYGEAHSSVNETSLLLEDQWRRCASLDMVVRCETDLQYSSSEVIETMCKYASEIQKIYTSIYGDKSFKVPLNPRSVSEINDFINFINEIPDIIPDLLDDDTIKRNWLLYYYISRWAFVMRIYFVRCTSQMDIAEQCGILSEYAAEKARKWRTHTGEMIDDANFVLKEEVSVVQDDFQTKIFKTLGTLVDLLANEKKPSKDPFLGKLAGVQDWVDAHVYIQTTLKLMTEGDYQNAANILLLVEAEIERMQHTDKMGKEYEIQLKAKRFYSQACVSEDNYEDAIAGLRELFIDAFVKFPKIAKEIKIFEARAALRYSKLDDAIPAFRLAKVMVEKVNTAQNGISDGWLDLVEAQIALLKHENPDSAEGKPYSLSESAQRKAFLVCSKVGRFCPDFVLGKIQSAVLNVFAFEEDKPLEFKDIESKFKAYTIEESVISRPGSEFLPLEAQRLFVLGMVEIEQIRNKYDHQKYLNGVAYLLNAYSILLELDSKDKLLLDQIEKSYKELLRINYENSGFSEDQIETILSNLSVKEVAKRNQLEQWTKALLKIISEQKLTSGEDCEDDFSTTLVRIIPRFISSASNIQLIKQKELPKWDLKSNDEYSVIQEGTVEKDGKKIYVTTLSLNTNDEYNRDDHTIVIESAHELTKYTKGALMMIATALEKALKIHSLYKNSNDGVIEDRQRLYDLTAPLTNTLLDEATIEHKRRIQEFIRIFCEEWNKEHAEVLNMSFDIDLLINAAAHHDTGKAGSPLIVLLKPGALNDPEFASIKPHPVDGASKLYRLLGFDDIVKYELVHHIQEGNRIGYPEDLKGKRYQQEINEWIAKNFEPLTEEERQKLRGKIESLQGKRNKDVIMSFDILEALNAKSRAYRDTLTAKQLVGFAISNIGINFPHYLINAFVRYVNKGLFNELISHGEIPNGVKNEFQLPVSYKLDDVIEYVESMGEEAYFNTFNLDHKLSIEGLSKGGKCGVAISREGIRAEMFGMYMRTYKINAKETEAKYGSTCDDFVKEFEKWTPLNGKQSVDDYYGANGYPDKDVQDASDEVRDSVSGFIGSAKK